MIKIKIYDKKFLKYVKQLKIETESIFWVEFAQELENILKTKELTVENIQTLFPFLYYRVNNPSYYLEEFNAGIAIGRSFYDMNHVINEIKKEHRYMYKYIKKFYSIEEPMPDFYLITSNNNDGEVA